MWYPGRQKVLEMINVFSQYLQNKIKKQKKAEKDKQSAVPLYAQTVKIEKNYGQINSIEDSDVTYNSK